MIFHFSAKKCLNNPRKSSTAAIYGLYCCLSRIFGVFDRFSCGFGLIFYHFLNRFLWFRYNRFLKFYAVTIWNSNSLFSIDRWIQWILWFDRFDGFHWFYGFHCLDFIFWVLYLFLWSFFLVSFFGCPISCGIEIPVLSNVAMSPRNFSWKNMKKVEKTRKNTKKGGPEKRSFFDPFVPSAFFGKKCEKVLANSPPSGTFSIFFVRPRSCFYTVLVLVVGGVQSGGNFFCSFLKTFFRVCTFVFAILGVDIIPGGGV